MRRFHRASMLRDQPAPGLLLTRLLTPMRAFLRVSGRLLMLLRRTLLISLTGLGRITKRLKPLRPPLGRGLIMRLNKRPRQTPSINSTRPRASRRASKSRIRLTMPCIRSMRRMRKRRLRCCGSTLRKQGSGRPSLPHGRNRQPRRPILTHGKIPSWSAFAS